MPFFVLGEGWIRRVKSFQARAQFIPSVGLCRGRCANLRHVACAGDQEENKDWLHDVSQAENKGRRCGFFLPFYCSACPCALLFPYEPPHMSLCLFDGL